MQIAGGADGQLAQYNAWCNSTAYILTLENKINSSYSYHISPPIELPVFT
jgi:hypothetical protein